MPCGGCTDRKSFFIPCLKRASNVKICQRRSRNCGLSQIVIPCFDIDAPGGLRFAEIVILENIEGLNLLIGRQLATAPASAERADERN